VKKQTPPPKDRGSLTIAELLEMDAHFTSLDDVPPKSAALDWEPPVNVVSYLTIPVRDWLQKYLTGVQVPFADRIHPDQYKAVELAVALLQDAHWFKPEMLPTPALEFIEEWLYRLEEQTDLHVWNVADIARPFLTHALGSIVDDSDEHIAVAGLKAAISQLCTKEELNRFYKRHGLLDEFDERAYSKGSQKWRDQQVAIKAARVLADPSVSEETKNAIRDAINDLGMASGVSMFSPALAERALTLMFESKRHMVSKADTQRDRKRLRELINAVPDDEHTRKPASLKE
jgi:hypothetical protein